MTLEREEASPREVIGHATSAATPVRESLAEIGKRLQRELKSKGSAEFRVALEVRALAAEWDQYRQEAGDIELGEWLKRHVDRTNDLKWYDDRARAYDVAKPLGLHTKAVPAALLWFMHQVTGPAEREKAAAAIKKKWHEGDTKLVLKLSQIRVACKEFIVPRPTEPGETVGELRERIQQLEAHVERLQEQVRGLGAEPVE